MESISEPLALFLEALLEEASTVRVVVDNFRGLGEEDAESYFPPPPSERISNTSLPELCRWGNSSCQLLNLAAAEGDTDGEAAEHVECPSSPTTAAPKVPRRRTSLDSEDDNCEDYWGAEADESTSWGCDSDESPSSSSTLSAIDEIPNSPLAWQAKFASLQDTIFTDMNSSLKDTRSPPKAPKRQSSLRFDQDTALLPTNVSLPTPDQLESADIQKVHKRRYGVSFLASPDALSSMLSSQLGGDGHQSIENPSTVLEKIHREVCIREDDILQEEDTDESPMFSRRRSKQDSSPNCARRRPSPQLDKFASFGMDDSSSKAPSCAKRRPSPQLMEKTECIEDYDSSPARAKRRPSPEDYETFGNLVDALGGTTSTIFEEAKQ